MGSALNGMISRRPRAAVAPGLIMHTLLRTPTPLPIPPPFPLHASLPAFAMPHHPTPHPPLSAPRHPPTRRRQQRCEGGGPPDPPPRPPPSAAGPRHFSGGRPPPAPAAGGRSGAAAAGGPVRRWVCIWLGRTGWCVCVGGGDSRACCSYNAHVLDAMFPSHPNALTEQARRGELLSLLNEAGQHARGGSERGISIRGISIRCCSTCQ